MSINFIAGSQKKLYIRKGKGDHQSFKHDSNNPIKHNISYVNHSLSAGILGFHISQHFLGLFFKIVINGFA